MSVVIISVRGIHWSRTGPAWPGLDRKLNSSKEQDRRPDRSSTDPSLEQDRNLARSTRAIRNGRAAIQFGHGQTVPMSMIVPFVTFVQP